MKKTSRRVVLYSGGQERRNALIHETLLDLALRQGAGRFARRSRRGLQQKTPGVRMTYMPYTSQGALPFFRRFERRYRAHGATQFHCVAADDTDFLQNTRARREAAATIKSSDIVYLAGGNTFYFLAHLRRSGLLEDLARFAQRGGVVAGLSAGALILTPHIGLAGYPPFDADENEPGLTRLQCRSLGLVNFEFFPHYRRSARYRDALTLYSQQNHRPVYACADGSGIVVEGDRFTAHGDVWRFQAGQMAKIGA